MAVPDSVRYLRQSFTCTQYLQSRTTVTISDRLFYSTLPPFRVTLLNFRHFHRIARKVAIAGHFYSLFTQKGIIINYLMNTKILSRFIYHPASLTP